MSGNAHEQHLTQPQLVQKPTTNKSLSQKSIQHGHIEYNQEKPKLGGNVFCPLWLWPLTVWYFKMSELEWVCIGSDVEVFIFQVCSVQSWTLRVCEQLQSLRSVGLVLHIQMCRLQPNCIIVSHPGYQRVKTSAHLRWHGKTRNGIWWCYCDQTLF